MAHDQSPTLSSRRNRRLHALFIAVATGIGVCEALTVSPWIDWSGVADAVALPITMIGFGAFIVLLGPFGNAAAAFGLFLIARLRWQWPLWRCLALASPCLYVTCRSSPKPW